MFREVVAVNTTAFTLLVIIHIPVIVVMTAQMFRHSFVAHSVIIHASLLGYWTLNAIRFSTFMLGYDHPSSTLAQQLILIQSIICLPLIVFVWPTLRYALILPCISAYRNAIFDWKEKYEKLLEEKIEFERKHKHDLRTMERLFRNRTERMSRLVAIINASENYASLRSEAEGILGEFQTLKDKIKEGTVPPLHPLEAP